MWITNELIAQQLKERKEKLVDENTARAARNCAEHSGAKLLSKTPANQKIKIG